MAVDRSAGTKLRAECELMGGGMRARMPTREPILLYCVTIMKRWLENLQF